MDLSTQTNLIMLCRICMRDTVAVAAADIYEYEPLDTAQLNLHGMLGLICAPVFANMDIDEQKSRESFGMPKTACPDCIDKIVTAYKLRVTCIASDQKLWEIVMLKQELQSEEDIVFVEPKLEPQDDVDPLTTARAENLQDRVADNKSPGEHKNAEEAKIEPIDHNMSQPSKDCKKKNRNPKKSGKSLCIPNGVKGGKCALCPKFIREKSKLMIHMASVHPKLIYSCVMCDDVFFTEAQHEEHKLFHTTGRRYGCLECKKRFANRTGIFLHTRIHSKDSLLKCHECDRSFTNAYHLKIHLRTHTGEKPFACEQCPARFAYKHLLKNHNSTHNKEHIKQQNVVCGDCGSRFTSRAALAKHKRIHIGEPPCECDQCDKKFWNSHQLTRHKRSHTGEKPYKCAYCDSAFAQSNNLVKHSRSHVGAYPYKCDYCESSFRLLAELRDHFKVHFQPGDESEGYAMRVLESQQPTEGSEALKFTSTCLLNRRYKQEKEREQLEEAEKLADFGRR